MKVLNDLGIRALLSLILVVAYVAMIFNNVSPPEPFISIVTMAVTFYFANRSTLDKQK